MIKLNDALHLTSKEISKHDLFELIKGWSYLEAGFEHLPIISWLPSIVQIDFYNGKRWEESGWFRIFFSDKNEDMIEFKNSTPIETLLEEYVNNIENK